MKIRELIRENTQENSKIHSLSDKAGGGAVIINDHLDTDGNTVLYSAEYVTKNNEMKFKYEFKNNEKRWFDDRHRPPKGELWAEQTSQSDMIDKFMQRLTQEIIQNNINYAKRIKIMKETDSSKEQLLAEVKQQVRPILEQLTMLMRNTKEYKEQIREQQESIKTK